MARMIDGDVVTERLRSLLESPHEENVYNSGYDDAIWHVLDVIEHMPTLTPPNEPLTSDELREMDGQPVYVVPENEYSELGGWCVISADDSDDYSCALVPGTDCWRWMFEAYGEQWLAYRRPPEGEV